MCQGCHNDFLQICSVCKYFTHVVTKDYIFRPCWGGSCASGRSMIYFKMSPKLSSQFINLFNVFKKGVAKVYNYNVFCQCFVNKKSFGSRFCRYLVFSLPLIILTTTLKYMRKLFKKRTLSLTSTPVRILFLYLNIALCSQCVRLNRPMLK